MAVLLVAAVVYNVVVRPGADTASQVAQPGVQAPRTASSPAADASQALQPLPTALVQATAASATPAPREIRANVRELEANYTVVAGDSLNVIAARHNTTAERIQALNNLADPRLLNIGQKLIVPPPL